MKMERNNYAGGLRLVKKTVRRRAILPLALSIMLCLSAAISGCSMQDRGEPDVRAAFKMWYTNARYEELYKTGYYALYRGERMGETEPFEPDKCEMYRLKGVDFRGLYKPLEWDKLVDESGRTLAAEGDMKDILGIMYGEYGDKTYLFDDFEILKVKGEYYLYTRTYVSVHTVYRYNRDTKTLTELGKTDNVNIMEIVGLAVPEE